MPGPQFRMGTEEAEKASARTSFIRTGYLKIEEDQSAFVRLLTDHDKLVTVLQHNAAPTRAKPENHTGKWPQTMPGVCRNDKAFAGMYPDCFLDLEWERTGNDRAFKPKSRSWGLGIVRKKRMVEGRHIGFEDEMIEIVDSDKQKIMIPRIVTMNFSWVNFWNNFAALKEIHGTWLDRDVLIKRTGKELDSDYSVAQGDPVGLDGLKATDANPAFDPRIMEHAAPYITAIGLDPKDFESSADAFRQALGTLVAERATDEFYDRFFDTRHAQPVSSVVPADVHEKPADDGPSESALAEMAARVGQHPTPDQPATISFG